MKQIDKISVKELQDMAKRMYGDLVKAVIDIEQKKLVVDAEMHSDEEQYLLENGSKQNDLWGINLLLAKFGTDEFVEFDSMINIRPRQNNVSRGVDSPKVRERIRQIVEEIIYE